MESAVKRSYVLLLTLVAVMLLPVPSRTQSSALVSAEWFQVIRDESSGERPLVDYKHIESHYWGFTPSKGGDQIAEYIAGRMREEGLEKVTIDGFPVDGKTFFWAWLGEPAWDVEVATLDMLEPRGDHLADIAQVKGVLGRYSTSADVTTDLVDVGEGLKPTDYAGKDVRGKIVLATGTAELVHREAVWRYGAAGVLHYSAMVPTDAPYRVDSPALGNRTGPPAIVAWRGPNGEAPGFLFGLSYANGIELKNMLSRGQRVVLKARVKATTGPGEYKQVEAVVTGTDPSLKEVWIKGHDNYRNGGGLNNLTGVGAVMEVARVLHALVAEGKLPRPRRTIRFLWSAEHFGSIYQFSKDPERRNRVFSFFSVDMVGFHQEKTKAVARLYRLPYSMAHFVSDASEEIFRSVAAANTSSARYAEGGGMPAPIYAPTGSRDQQHSAVEEFWAPSDHEDMVEGSIGIPSLEFGNPGGFMPPQWDRQPVDDGIDKVDPTQMRRSVVTIAAAGYYLANLTADGVPRLATTVVAYAEGRMARDMSRAFGLIEGASAADFTTQYREARNILAESIRRELATVDSMQQLGPSPAANAAIARARTQLQGLQAANESAFRDRATGLAADLKVAFAEPTLTPAEQRLATLVPKRNEAIRGPVNLFRPEYGAIWLAQKVGDENFLTKVRLASRGRFVPYEALNFVDGKRNLLDIRNAVSAEYGPMDPTEVEEYFRFLEKAGVVTISAPLRVPAK
jgi:hypothetical protein